MKIFASNNFSPIKSLKKAAKIAAVTLPLMTAAESCSPWLYPPPPPPHPHHRPIPHRKPPHHRPRPHFWWFLGATQPQDTIQYTDIVELSKPDLAYIDNTEQNK